MPWPGNGEVSDEVDTVICNLCNTYETSDNDVRVILMSGRDNRFNESSSWYVEFIEKFYNDDQFNSIYNKWVHSGKQKYFMPSVDHILPKAKGGTNAVDNLQILSWFENRCKNDMSQEDWNILKNNIQEYFI